MALQKPRRAVRSPDDAAAETRLLSQIRSWHQIAEQSAAGVADPVSVWMDYAEKVQNLRTTAYREVSEAVAESGTPRLRLLIGLDEREELAMRTLDEAINQVPTTWRADCILAGLW